MTGLAERSSRRSAPELQRAGPGLMLETANGRGEGVISESRGRHDGNGFL
jgi:hypothetical protein